MDALAHLNDVQDPSSSLRVLLQKVVGPWMQKRIKGAGILEIHVAVNMESTLKVCVPFFRLISPAAFTVQIQRLTRQRPGPWTC
jgi:hypothetical protein